MLNLDELQKLQADLQLLNLRVLNEKLGEGEREAARKKTVELANRIAMVAEKGDAPVFIINLNKRLFRAQRSWGSNYWISGCGKKQFSSTLILPVVASKQAGPGNKNKPTERVYISARKVAEDICREINGDLLALGVSSTFSSANEQEGPRLRKTLGVFISDSSIPAKEHLEQEELDLSAYYAALVDEGDAIYAKNRDRKFLSNLHFEAAAYLGVDDREWTMNYLSQVSCPGCGARVSMRAAICPTCKWVLNVEAVQKQQAIKEKLGLNKGA
jgi:hypothetical protein